VLLIGDWLLKQQQQIAIQQRLLEEKQRQISEQQKQIEELTDALDKLKTVPPRTAPSLQLKTSSKASAIKASARREKSGGQSTTIQVRHNGFGEPDEVEKLELENCPNVALMSNQ